MTNGTRSCSCTLPLPRWREFERHDPTRQAPDDVSPHRARFEPGRRITWLGRVLIPGLFDGEHTLAVENLPNGSTRFVQSETFRGVLVSLMPGILRDTDRGFEAMNLALRDRAESRFADQLRCGEVDVVFQ